MVSLMLQLFVEERNRYFIYFLLSSINKSNGTIEVFIIHNSYYK